MLFRVMLGAGLIKLRGDSCWRDLTCLDFFFETQPMPNPLSRFFAHLPRWFHVGGVLFNHFSELLAPWFLLLGGPWRAAAGAVTAFFQATLIAGGNLSWLNYLTIALCLACFDDNILTKVLPRALTRMVPSAPDAAPRAGRRVAVQALAVVVGLLSVPPILNMLSPAQAMNASFEPFHLVNTYGAFGSIGKERFDLIFEGSNSDDPATATDWKEYPFAAAPWDPARAPVQVAPYQPHLDWQLWFAAMADVRYYPWTLNLVWKLLHNDPGTLSLFGGNPFPDHPPRYVRAVLYNYKFAKPGNPEHVYWTRDKLGLWLPPLSVDSDQLKEALRQEGWLQ